MNTLEVLSELVVIYKNAPGKHDQRTHAPHHISSAGKVRIGKLADESDRVLLESACELIPSEDLDLLGIIGTERPAEFDQESALGWRYSGMAMEGWIVASYDRISGEVRIHPEALRPGSRLLKEASETPQGIIAHEVAHSVYEKRLDDSQKESIRYLSSQIMGDFADGSVSQNMLGQVGLRPYALYGQGRELYSELYRIAHTRDESAVETLSGFLDGYKQDTPWKSLVHYER